MLLRIDRAPAPQPARLETFARRHGLTAAERRVAAAALEHRRAPAIALALRVAVVTVRFHLRNIYDKTGARGVPALIALLHAEER